MSSGLFSWLAATILLAFTENCVATGFGSHIAVPILRKVIETKADSNVANLTYDDALAALKEAMTVCYYRDCRYAVSANLLATCVTYMRH